MKGLKNEKIGLWLFKLTLYQELTMWETLVNGYYDCKPKKQVFHVKSF
jgi:hypothetical protein